MLPWIDFFFALRKVDKNRGKKKEEKELNRFLSNKSNLMTWHKERQIVVNNVNLWRHTDKQSRMSDFHTKDYAFYLARDKLLMPYFSIFHFISFRAISLEYNTLMYVHKKSLNIYEIIIHFFLQ